MCRNNSQRLFKYTNRFMFIFGLLYLVYSFILAFVSPLQLAMMVFTFVFCVLLIISSFFSQRMLLSQQGTVLYLVLSLLLLIQVIFLESVALFDGYLAHPLHAVVFVCEILLTVAIYAAALHTFRQRDIQKLEARHELLH